MSWKPTAKRRPAAADTDGVAARCRDVGMHPFERGHLVEFSIVARRVVARFLGEVGMRQITEHAYAVIKGDGHHALFGQSFAIVNRHGPRSYIEAAAVNVDEHRQFGAGGLGGSPYVHVEAIFADLGVGLEFISPLAGRLVEFLHAAWRETIRLADALPGNYRLGSAPAQIPYRRGREGNAFERDDGWVFAGHAGDLPAGDLHGLVDRGSGRHTRQETKDGSGQFSHSRDRVNRDRAHGL